MIPVFVVRAKHISTVLLLSLLLLGKAHGNTIMLSSESLRKIEKQVALDKSKVLVLFNILQGCPLVLKYQSTLSALDNSYSPGTLKIINIDSSSTARSDEDETKTFLKSTANKFPLFIDQESKIAYELSLTTASEIAVIDLNSRRLTYRGPIDDQHRIEFSRPKASEHYLLDAINRALDKTKPRQSLQTIIRQPSGCLINLAKK
jgi:hypothetical protein